MPCFVTCHGLPLDRQQHFCEAMCDHVLVNVYISRFAKYGTHKLNQKIPPLRSKGVLTKATVSNKEKIHVKAANDQFILLPPPLYTVD